MKNEAIALLQIDDMYKQFSGNSVLKGVSLTLQKGEVHALVGGNGAGKSTLMKMITGIYKPDNGIIKIKGKDVAFSNTQEAHKHGIYLVPQEPLIFPNMSVEENIMIGLPDKKKVLKEKMENIIRNLCWKLELDQSALSLSIAEQQLLEIIRGLVREAEILILDEPTSTLTFGEINSLFQTIQQLTEQGLGVFYITHRFTEIFTLADTVSVLRDGIISAQGAVSTFTYEKLLDGLMPENMPRQAKIPAQTVPVLIEENPSHPACALVIENLCGNGFENITFTLNTGEVLGIAGVVGAGRTEVAEALIGLTPADHGTILLEGTDIGKFSVRERINRGLVYVPEDRHSHGIFSIASIQKNITSTILDRLKGLLLPSNQEKKIASKYVADLKIKSTGIGQELKDISGGNQQKVVLGKYLAAEPKVIILDEPTRGIDANARRDIYRIIQDLKAKGLAVLLISSDIEEIEKLSDRVLVMHEGKIVKTLAKHEVHIDIITTSAFGVKKEVIN
ncbi:sugar ABC transporter ATP-binding protein [Metabacillus arenae]|uniref:Autoinducer 2 import ATP-binding protein LsrA n=1 Tax=Metabacillus arenae TaxID=2771434 RepID=A0A926N8J7_9BACI|nr:ATP-binding cassette domain-containing protein [Metabacillus arenae]MBD1379447.1 ATP-binding cassette domain-containing protein [Metabacillus arenae]